MNQEQLFNAIKQLGVRVDLLASFVQNDFDLLIAEGVCTVQDLTEWKQQAEQEFSKSIGELGRLRSDVVELISSKIVEVSGMTKKSKII